MINGENWIENEPFASNESMIYAVRIVEKQVMDRLNKLPPSEDAIRILEKYNSKPIESKTAEELAEHELKVMGLDSDGFTALRVINQIKDGNFLFQKENHERHPDTAARARKYASDSHMDFEAAVGITKDVVNAYRLIEILMEGGSLDFGDKNPDYEKAIRFAAAMAGLHELPEHEKESDCAMELVLTAFQNAPGDLRRQMDDYMDELGMLPAPDGYNEKTGERTYTSTAIAKHLGVPLEEMNAKIEGLIADGTINPEHIPNPGDVRPLN